MRARNIKPSMFKNELLGVADPLITILFQGLWCEADRDGRLEDRPLRIRAEIFPYRNDVDVESMLKRQNDNGFIQRYDALGTKVIQIVKFSEHQRPHHNEVKSILPPLDSSKHTQGKKSLRPREAPLRSDSLLSDSPSLIPDPPKDKIARAARSLASRLAEDWQPDAELEAYAAAQGVDPGSTAENFRDYWHAASGAKARKHDWAATWRMWCRNQADRDKARPPRLLGSKAKTVAQLEQEEREHEQQRSSAIR